jgi:TfoX/Sxy family transcriptional regulator of competence genes
VNGRQLLRPPTGSGRAYPARSVACDDAYVAFDEELAARVRELVGHEPGLTEKRMFGGLAMLLDGNMAVVVRGKGGLMVRVDPADYERVLTERGAAPAQMRGRPMRGWVTVSESGCATDADLGRWVARGVTAARNLPRK